MREAASRRRPEPLKPKSPAGGSLPPPLSLFLKMGGGVPLATRPLDFRSKEHASTVRDRMG